MRILSIIILLFSITSMISCKKSVTEEVNLITQSQTVAEQAVESDTKMATPSEVIEKEEAEPAAIKVSEEKTEKIKKEAEEVVNRKRAKITFTEKEYDYGMISQGDEVQHDFMFTNTGNADLVIKSAEATCGCTTPEYPFIPIKPGETGKIGVKFNSTGKLGPQKPMITLVTNASPRVHRIYLKGFVNSSPKEKVELLEEEVEMNPENNVSKGSDNNG